MVAAKCSMQAGKQWRVPHASVPSQTWKGLRSLGAEVYMDAIVLYL